MPHAPSSRSLIADEPFRLVGGHVAADLVNTVNWEARGLDRDRLSDYGRVVEWAVVAGVITDATAGALRRTAAARPAEAAAAYEGARWLRDVVRRLLTAVGEDALNSDRGGRALGDFNALLATTVRPLRLAPLDDAAHAAASSAGVDTGLPRLVWTWDDPAAPRLDAFLRPVIWETAQMLTSADAARLRVCAGQDCGWVYVDRSRNGLRRWCEMQTCGTLAKSRRRTARQREGG